MDCSVLGYPVLHYLPGFSQMIWVGNAIQTFHPLSPPPPALSLSQHQSFFNESVPCIRWPKNWSFIFSISPSSDYSRLTSFRMDWFDLFVVQRTPKTFLQHHNSKESVLWRSAFFIVQLSHPYMTTGKTIALIMWTFVSQVMSLLLNVLSRFVIAFLPRSKCLLISWLQSPAAVILEPQKIKSVTVSTFPASTCHEVMGPDAIS